MLLLNKQICAQYQANLSHTHTCIYISQSITFILPFKLQSVIFMCGRFSKVILFVLVWDFFIMLYTLLPVASHNCCIGMTSISYRSKTKQKYLSLDKAIIYKKTQLVLSLDQVKFYFKLLGNKRSFAVQKLPPHRIRNNGNYF